MNAIKITDSAALIDSAVIDAPANHMILFFFCMPLFYATMLMPLLLIFDAYYAAVRFSFSSLDVFFAIFHESRASLHNILSTLMPVS